MSKVNFNSKVENIDFETNNSDEKHARNLNGVKLLIQRLKIKTL